MKESNFKMSLEIDMTNWCHLGNKIKKHKFKLSFSKSLIS